MISLTSKLKYAAILLLMPALFFMTSCGEDDPNSPGGGGGGLVEDGIYIVGAATAFDGPVLNGKFSTTNNEVGQEPRATLQQVYAALKAGQDFNFVSVEGGEETTNWGPASDFADVTSGTTDEPQVTFQRGGFTGGNSKFNVPSDGLYHIAFDTELGIAVIIPVSWGVIGSATPGGWGSDTPLTESAFSTSAMSWTATDVTLTNGEWKFRNNGGWKVEFDTAGTVKINTNLGGAVDDLEEGGGNLPNTQNGTFDLAINWAPGAGQVFTADVTLKQANNDSTCLEKIGLIGEGLSFDGNQYNWSNDTLAVNSSTNAINTACSWTFNNVGTNTNGAGFKFRSEGTWDKVNLGFSALTFTGDGASDFSANGDDILPSKASVYKMVLSYDDGTWSLDVKEND